MTRSTGSSNPAYEHLRAAALRFPEAVEEFPWGHSAIKVRGKAFVFMGGEGGKFGLSCKLPHSHEAALLLPFATPTGYGLGRSGWVSANFEHGDGRVPLALLEEWIGESYRAVAPKKLAALVEGPGTGVAPGRSAGGGAKKAARAGSPDRSSGTGAKKAAKAGSSSRSSGTGAKKAAKAAAPGGSARAGVSARRAG